MGQVNDKSDDIAKRDDGPSAEAGGLRHAAVAIDPPPRGALGIRELLELLEKEVGQNFPAGSAGRGKIKKPQPDPARRRA